MSNATQQQKAYDAGVQDGILAGVQPTDLKFIQDFNGFDGEELVCYLNGVGDGVSLRPAGRVPFNYAQHRADWSTELPKAA